MFRCMSQKEDKKKKMTLCIQKMLMLSSFFYKYFFLSSFWLIHVTPLQIRIFEISDISVPPVLPVSSYHISQ